MDSKIILAGIGGQGVLFAHQAIAACAIAQGFDVTGAETHGMSQRGGSVVSHLKIGDTSAPLIRQGTADFLLAFDAAEAYRSLPYVRRGGAIIVNSGIPNYPDERVRAHLATMNVTMRVVNADAIARGLGRASAANVALIGFATTCENFPLSRDAMRATLAKVAPERFLDINLKAFDEGVMAGN